MKHKIFNNVAVVIITANVMLYSANCFSQGVAINTTGTAADASAILDVSSSSAGMLIPRMTKIQRNAIGLPAEGLLIYQTDDTVGFWYRSSGVWKLMGSGAGSSIANGTAIGNTLYWDGSQWIESSNIYNAGASVGIGTNNPEPTAKVEINSTNSGFLIPRMTTAERDLIGNPAEGLQIFNTTTKCFEYYAYGFWQQWHCATCFMPDDAGTITGSSVVCQGVNVVNYSVPTINNATSYTWSYTGTGATINGSTEAITVDFSSSATSGNLTVKGTNQCGDGVVSSNFPITVNSIPSSPTAGTHTPSQTEIIWNWNIVTGATGYKYNTVDDYGTATDNGSSTSFTQSGLTCNTAYILYVWAYNNCGKSDVSILTDTTSSCWSCGYNITDNRDATIYQTVQIGNQCWMKENLKYLPVVHSNSEFATQASNLQSGYGVHGYDGNNITIAKSQSNYSTYGVLYNWFAATGGTSSSSNPSGVQGVCPIGWHLPSDAEWKQLEMYLGMSQSTADLTGWRGTDEAGKLKATSLWNLPNTGATNSSGFTALPSGKRYSSSFSNLGDFDALWSASENGASNAWARYLYYNYATVERYAGGSKGDGCSVRCLLD